MSLDWFQADVLATKAEYERSDAMPFISSCYPRASWNLIGNFMRDIRKLSIGLVLALYGAFGHERFLNGAFHAGIG